MTTTKQIKRYAKLNYQNVFLMDKATKSLNTKGYIVVQSLKNGLTAIVKESLISGINTKYPL